MYLEANSFLCSNFFLDYIRQMSPNLIFVGAQQLIGRVSIATARGVISDPQFDLSKADDRVRGYESSDKGASYAYSLVVPFDHYCEWSRHGIVDGMNACRTELRLD